MPPHFEPRFFDPALTVAVALAAGMLAQALAGHLRIPGIVLLLATGVLLGPDLLGVVQPDSLGGALQVLVGFAVAIILFEGGMNLDIRRLRREALSIRQLVTVGALVTAAGGAVAARLLLGWPWSLSILFGTLVIVTGPTVVTPIVRRLRLKPSVATVLEAEGVLIDAIGAVIAVVTLEAVLHPAAGGFWEGALAFAARIGFGIVVGAVGGLLIAVLMRFDRLVPEGLENVLMLGLVLVLFQTSNLLVEESGIMSVTAAGLTVGNVKTRLLDDLKQFKEQLTVLMIGLLFVLLAADVRIDEVRSLGLPGALTVLALMFVVRPLNVAVGTLGSSLTARERVFISWLAPRGIVAAAVSSLFAQELAANGIAGGKELRALVFLVIAVTVFVQGLTGGLLARALGLRRPTSSGYVILGANPLGLALGSAIRQAGHEVVFIDSGPDACRVAEEAGFRVLFGSGIAESILYRAELDSRAGCLAVTSNDEVNLLFAKKAREEFKLPLVWVALRSGHQHVTPQMVEAIGAQVLFAQPRNLDLWGVRLERAECAHERWFRKKADSRLALEEIGNPPDPDGVMLPLAVIRGRSVLPFVSDLNFRRRDQLHVLVAEKRRDEAEAWLYQMGWEPWREPEADDEAEADGADPVPEPA